MFSRKKVPFPFCQTIGVCGMEHGIGTTHFALALSNFLCNKLKKRTAYVEMNDTRQIISLVKDESLTSFSYLDIQFYPSAIQSDLPYIFNGHPMYIVMDLGILSSDNYWDFYRCDIKFIIGSFSPWKVDRFHALLESIILQKNTEQEHIMILGNPGIKEISQRFQRKYHLPSFVIPYLPNPFQLTTANCTFFQDVMAKY